MKIVALLIFSFLLSNLGYGQISYYDSLAAVKKQSKDSIRQEYIHELKDYINFGPVFSVRNLSLELRDSNDQIEDLTYRPSSASYLGFGINLFDLNFELSFKLPQNETNTPSAIFGETRAFDFQSNIYTKKWGADLVYQRYSGLYLDNPNDHFVNRQSGDPYPIRDDLSLRYVQLNTFYVFNHHKFSFRAPYIFKDQQLKSAGSVITNLFVSTFRFASDSTLIPESAQPSLTGNEEFNRSRITTLAIMPGYSYSMVYGKFFLNGTLSAGPGHLWLRYNVEDANEEDIRIRPVINVRFAAGYNGDTFFGGLSFVNQAVSAEINDLEVISNSGNFKIYFGIRIKERGFLTKQFL